MKIFLLLSFIVTSIQAFEIQCTSQIENVLVVVKTSELTNNTYLLFLNDTEVEKYYPLTTQFLTIDDEKVLYQDQDTSLFIDKMKTRGQIVSTGSIFRDEAKIELVNCVEFP